MTCTREPAGRTLATVLACASLAAAAFPARGDGFAFGVLPYQVAARVGEAFSPVAAEFADLLETEVHLETSADLGEFGERLDQGAFDIALIDPVNAVRQIDAGVYRPFARRPSRPASVVVLPDSDIEGPADLRRRTLGLPAPGTPVDVFVHDALLAEGLRPGRDLTVERMKPGRCLHRLLLRRIDACATGGGASRKVFERDMGVSLRTAMETRSFPHMVFATHVRVPETAHRALRGSVLGWQDTQSGRRLLQRIGPDAEFTPYVDSDYDVVREAIATWRRRESTVPQD